MATLPVLPLTDAVLLPGMVIPVTLDPTTQAAVDAARATGDKQLLAVPRIDGEYGSVGVVATIEKVGRLPSGEPAAVIRGLTRARIGSGVPGPGAALWVEATTLDEPAPAGRARELAREYRALMTSVLQQRGAWQVIDAMERMTDLSELADSAGYAPWLSLTQKTELLAAPDVTARLELLVGWVKEHLAEQEVTEQINSDVREGLEKSQREFLLRQQLAAIRKELGEDEPDVDAGNLARYLGRPKFTPESAERTAVPGVATGLAVTGAGGDVLFIEATTMEGEPGLTLTGQLGDVMKESAHIAWSYLRSNGRRHGLDPNALAGRRIHLHVPAGAVPKDGPSAGITMVTALASLVTGRPVRPEFGMTGEVTLSGRVLPIGGVKQKLLAAHRAGLTEVIIPKRNEPDLDDLPAQVREALTVHTLSDVADVLALALRPAEIGTESLDGPALAAA
ncbi:S16 family serine protease [Micromonospora marina]|uniref:endopeptidase La n=1 Tax=Micromonospora marina TaxID=307120 RepID=A0A1C4WBR1_9ACTN|nr:S16 family serine protease [Micromonospora marina]SCE93655.1 ATP-dependent protease La (LON) substrate-binding domain-containing protein [Micromonospora marina]